MDLKDLAFRYLMSFIGLREKYLFSPAYRGTAHTCPITGEEMKVLTNRFLAAGDDDWFDLVKDMQVVADRCGIRIDFEIEHKIIKFPAARKASVA